MTETVYYGVFTFLYSKIFMKQRLWVSMYTEQNLHNKVFDMNYKYPSRSCRLMSVCCLMG